jgi:5'(3')-deoxyribonucleotidase
MQTKTLLVDMDAIVADLATEWYDRWNKSPLNRSQTSLTVDDVTQWDVGKAIGNSAVYSILKEPGLYRVLKPLPGAIDGLKEVFGMKVNGVPAYDVFFLTASITAPHILADKAYWVAEHFPFIKPKKLIFAYHKERVMGDVFIDDSPKNLARFRAAQPATRLVTIDYPYNKDAQVDFRAQSHKNTEEAWGEIAWWLSALARTPNMAWYDDGQGFRETERDTDAY